MQNDKEQFKKDFIRRLIRFTIALIRLGEKVKERNKLLWSLVDQSIRSGGSIGANVVEAKGSGSKKDYIHYFEIALKSANETTYWLMVLRETVESGLRNEIEVLYRENVEIAKIIGASILTMKDRR
ncbi:MAG: four helix bundle protein [Patescibacteria group bacterium]